MMRGYRGRWRGGGPRPFGPGFRGRGGARGRGGWGGGPPMMHHPGMMMPPRPYFNPQNVRRERERAEKSVYVRGIPSGTGLEQIQALFAEYGAIENVMLNMDKVKGMYALVVFEDKESLEKVLAEESIKMDGQELTIEGKRSKFDLMAESRKLQRDVVRSPENAVYIKGFEEGTKDTLIKEFFQQYGNVTGVLARFSGHHNMPPSQKRELFHYVIFENKEDAEKVIAMGTLQYNDRELTVDAKKTREEMVELRRSELDHSVYVHGFDEEVSEDQLINLFKGVGSIEKVFLDKGRKGAYAFVEFQTPDAVEKAISLENLSLGDKPITVKKRELRTREPKRKMPVRRVYYGPPKPVVNHLELINKMKDCSTLEEQMQLILTEVELSDEDKDLRENIASQLEGLFANIFPGSTIHQFGSSVNGFGVKGTDMDLFLDLNLDQDYTKEELEGFEKPTLPYLADIQSLQVVDERITRESLRESSVGDRIRLVSRILSASAEGAFNNFLTIRAARCPVIKFVHVETEMRCDLSIDNKLALNNTRLLQAYSEYDPRIRPLVYAIRYWARCKELAGNITNGPRLTNYALYLMVFAYLNNVTPPMLPTVDQLAKLAAFNVYARPLGVTTLLHSNESLKKYEIFTNPQVSSQLNNDEMVAINDWDCSVQTDRSKIPFPVNNQPLEQLLGGFFQFYANFDFNGKILAARGGTIADRKEYQTSIENGEDERMKETRFSPVVLLDPFVLNHNTAANVNARTRGRICYELQQADAKFKHDRFYKLSSPIDMDWGMCFLLSRDRIRTRTQAAVNELQQYHINLLQVAPYNLPISMKVSQLPAQLLQSGPDSEDFKDRWCLEITQFIQRCLAELLLCELQDANDLLHEQQEMEANTNGGTGDSNTSMNENGKRGTLEGDVAGEIETKRLKLEKLDPNCIVSALKCSTRYRMWANRKSLKKEIKAQTNQTDEYQLESEVTRHMSQVSPPALDSIIEYYLTFSKETCSGVTMLRLNMYPTIGAKEFTCFFTFLSAFIAKVVDKSFSINI